MNARTARLLSSVTQIHETVSKPTIRHADTVSLIKKTLVLLNAKPALPFLLSIAAIVGIIGCYANGEFMLCGAIFAIPVAELSGRLKALRLKGYLGPCCFSGSL